VIHTELMPEDGSVVQRGFSTLQAALSVLFAVELLAKAAAHWRTPRGSPFTSRCPAEKPATGRPLLSCRMTRAS
jgi:hypothetical protein